MDDQLHKSAMSRNFEAAGVSDQKRVSKRNLSASGPKAFPQSLYRHIASLNNGRIGSGTACNVAAFLLKVAALETVRRVSRAKCPYLWRGLQALQVLCYPPLKCIQRWAPLKGLIKGMQMLSRPLLVVSIATAFADESDCSNETSDSVGASHGYSELLSEPLSEQSPSDESLRIDDETPGSLASEDWLIRLHEVLENQGITLPERINEDELRRFHAAANGDFSSFLSSVKKTIRWRDTYRILSEEELATWSNMVFWHGFDVKHRPCLIIRLGLACLKLPSHERPRFAQALISQVEHGVLHLVDPENPEITVLVDCEGLSPLRIPMQVMRSCSSLLQDHFPNRLGCLFVIRLPPVVRVIAQTFIQVLKPVTRKKFRIEGEMFHRVLFENLQTFPSYLGGHCTCIKCSRISNQYMGQSDANKTSEMMPNIDVNDNEDLPISHRNLQDDIGMNVTCDQVLRTAIVSMLMFWVFIALIAGIYDSESRLF